MRDGDTSAKIADNEAQCVACLRRIYAGELYGAHGVCSQCLETECRGDGIGGE